MKPIQSALVTTGICLLILGLAVLGRPQQCIESSIVDKFDVVKFETRNNENTTYRCGSSLKNTYSKNIDVFLNDLNQRSNQVITSLTNISDFSESLHISVDETDPLKFQVDSKKIIIGRDLYLARGHFERAMIMSWFKQQVLKNKLNIKSYQLIEESFVDLMYFYIYGKFDIFDPTTQIQTKIGSSPWPQILKNQKSYCESSWKLSEDYSFCQQVKNFKNDINSEKIIDTSVRPLLTSAFIDAFNQINFRQKNKFIKDMTYHLSVTSLDSEIKYNEIIKFDNPLTEGLNNIKIFLAHFSSYKDLKSEIETAFFYRIKNYLQQQGVSESYSEAYFDYLFEVSDRLSEQSILFNSLLKHSMNHLNLQIAIKDAEKIWILPSKTSLPLSVFNQIKSKQHIYFQSSDIKSVNVADFVKTSEKLMIVKGLDSKKDYKFDILFNNNILDFIKEEKDIAFIQFHLPSLETRLNELKHISNYFELVQSRDVSRSEFQQLGWQGLQWIDQYKYYKPKAVIDAIEYFRLEPKAKN